jgi:flagellar biosynthetic protein FliR
MAELTDLLARHLDGFLLAFFRVGAMLAWAPGLGHRSVPLPHRAGLAALLAFIMTPTLTGSAREPARDALGWLLAVAGEVFVGLAIGFVAYLVLAAVEVAGELIGFEMGFSIAAVFDPAMGEQGTVVARFLHLLAMLLFLTMNGHHLLIRAVGVSFQRIAPGGLLEPAVSGGVASLGGKLLQSGVALAAPLVGILLVLNVALALVGRVAPQTNVFMVGLPLSIGVGILGLLDALPSLVRVFSRLVTEMPADLDRLFLGAPHGLR